MKSSPHIAPLIALLMLFIWPLPGDAKGFLIESVTAQGASKGDAVTDGARKAVKKAMLARYRLTETHPIVKYNAARGVEDLKEMFIGPPTGFLNRNKSGYHGQLTFEGSAERFDSILTKIIFNLTRKLNITNVGSVFTVTGKDMEKYPSLRNHLSGTLTAKSQQIIRQFRVPFTPLPSNMHRVWEQIQRSRHSVIKGAQFDVISKTFMEAARASEEGRVDFFLVGILNVSEVTRYQGKENWFAKGSIQGALVDYASPKDDVHASLKFSDHNLVGNGANRESALESLALKAARSIILGHALAALTDYIITDFGSGDGVGFEEAMDEAVRTVGRQVKMAYGKNRGQPGEEILFSRAVMAPHKAFCKPLATLVEGALIKSLREQAGEFRYTMDDRMMDEAKLFLNPTLTPGRRGELNLALMVSGRDDVKAMPAVMANGKSAILTSDLTAR
ncbi:MAG: hypothetical protein HQL53_10750, partial [Magnetococcales bacterium]|nr:hypothetical protein [Magnetococcales bacterium]